MTMRKVTFVRHGNDISVGLGQVEEERKKLEKEEKIKEKRHVVEKEQRKKREDVVEKEQEDVKYYS